MNSKQKKIKNNKKVRIFALFFLLSALFWLLIKLSREYTTTTQVSVVYKDLPENKILQSEVKDKINVKIKSIGFNLFKNKISTNELEVSLKNIRKKKGTTYYYLTSNLLDDLSDDFSKLQVIAIKPDTIYVDLSKSVSKKIKVVPNLDIQYQTGYNISGDLKISPKEIVVTGPSSQVDTITAVHTEELILKDVNTSIDEVLKIVEFESLDKVRYAAKKVEVTARVEKFTERSITASYTIINISNNYKISTFPKELELVFKIGLSDFNKISANDFEITCDFKEASNNGLSFLIPKITKKPSLVKDVKIVPNKIDFLLEK